MKKNGINLKEAMMQEENHRDVVTKTQESSSKKVRYSKNMEKRGESPRKLLLKYKISCGQVYILNVIHIL